MGTPGLSIQSLSSMLVRPLWPLSSPDVHCDKCARLVFGSWALFHGPIHLESNFSHHMNFLNWLMAVTTMRSGVQRKAMADLLKDAGAPLTNLFFKILVKSMFFWTLSVWGDRLTQQTPSSLAVSLSHWAAYSTVTMEYQTSLAHSQWALFEP